MIRSRIVYFLTFRFSHRFGNFLSGCCCYCFFVSCFAQCISLRFEWLFEFVALMRLSNDFAISDTFEKCAMEKLFVWSHNIAVLFFLSFFLLPHLCIVYSTTQGRDYLANFWVKKIIKSVLEICAERIYSVIFVGKLLIQKSKPLAADTKEVREDDREIERTKKIKQNCTKKCICNNLL